LHNGFGDRHGGHCFHGWRNGRHGRWWGGGMGWNYYPDAYGYYPDYGYYDYSQPYASQYWCYCSDPSGYNAYVTQCGADWQPVPAN
jgi:hypothetical protein